MTDETVPEFPEPDEIHAGRDWPVTHIGDWVPLSGISATAIALYVILAGHVNQRRGDQKAWPKREYLALMLGMKPTQYRGVGKYIDELVAINAIEVTEERYSKGMRRRYIYIVHKRPPDDYTGASTYKEWYEANKIDKDGDLEHEDVSAGGSGGARKRTSGRAPKRTSRGASKDTSRGAPARTTKQEEEKQEELEQEETKPPHTVTAVTAREAEVADASAGVCVDDDVDDEDREKAWRLLLRVIDGAGVGRARFTTAEADELVARAARLLRSGWTQATISARLKVINERTLLPFQRLCEALETMRGQAGAREGGFGAERGAQAVVRPRWCGRCDHALRTTPAENVYSEDELEKSDIHPNKSVPCPGCHPDAVTDQPSE